MQMKSNCNEKSYKHLFLLGVEGYGIFFIIQIFSRTDDNMEEP